MKTKFIIAIASLMLIGTTSVSCNSCEDKNNDPLPTGRPEVSDSDSIGTNGELTTTGSENATSGDATNEARNTNNGTATGQGASAGSPSSMGTAVNKARDGKSGATKKDRLEGYSAPNGTAAENYDGDPYTKHDTTSMPSGTSIR